MQCFFFIAKNVSSANTRLLLSMHQNFLSTWCGAYAINTHTSYTNVIANDWYINLFGDDDAIIGIAIAIAAIVIHVVVKIMVILNVKRIGASVQSSAAVAIWDVIVGIIAWDHWSVICPFRLFAMNVGLIVIIAGLCGPTFRYTWSLMRLIWRFVIL